MPRRLACLALLAACLVAIPSASAGTPGKWTQLGQQNLANIDEVALARTADGTLHAVWVIPGSNNDTLVHAAIGSNGTTAAPSVIQTGWASIDPVPDLLAGSGGLTALFGGIRSTDPNETNNYMNVATAPADGSSWSLTPGPVAKGDAAYGSDVGGALLPDGTPIFAFGGTGSGVFSHRGLDPNTPNFQLQDQLGSCCGYSPDVAVDASGLPYVLWISNATNQVGVFAQALDPNTGAPQGSPGKMPGSSTVFNGVDQSSQQLQRVPVVARAGGGVWAAYPGGYPTATKVVLWKVGTPKSIVVGSSKNDHLVSLAADPDGRLWVFWVDRSGSATVFARRSNKAANKFGPAIKVGHPPGQTSAYKIDGNAQSGTLDVVGLWGGATPQNAQWHTQVLPALVLQASPSKIKGAKSTKVEFTVSDPDPVKGAKVSVGGKSATTDAKGHATIALGPTKAKSLSATASKAGYNSAKKKIRTG